MYSRLYAAFLALILVLTASLPVAPAATAQGDAAWIAEYWPNRDLAGPPVRRGLVSELDIDWGLGSPDGLSVDNFSARFTRQVNFPGGPVRFFARSDDGVRLWVDNQLLIDRWFDQPAAEVHSAQIELTPGLHELRVEYFEHLDRAEIHVWWEVISPEQRGDWTATFWANQNLSGAPVLTTRLPEINFEWGLGSPTPALPENRFSARFTRTVTLSEGVYRFFARADDGVRLWVDDRLVIDQWRVGPVMVFRSDLLSLDAGPHNIRVECFEQTGEAILQVWWERVPAGGAAGPAPETEVEVWRAEFFSNPNLSGQPVIVTEVPQIDSIWGLDAPFANLPADNFSARWTTTVSLAGGNYEFIAAADDGVRVWLDGHLVINQWNPGPLRVARGVFFNAGAGTHTITVEYFEGTNLAAIWFDWGQIR